MKAKNISPWLIASMPLFCVAWLLAEIAGAIWHFGAIPRYLVDPDPFHSEWKAILPDLSAMYVILPWIVTPGLLVLTIRPFRYSGKSPTTFYGFATVSIFLMWMLIFKDATGFINWRLD